MLFFMLSAIFNGGYYVMGISTIVLIGANYIIEKFIIGKNHNFKTAILNTLLYFALACLFCAGITFYNGTHDGLIFATGYILEYFLSLDNIFVFILIMKSFEIGEKYMPKILSYGILATMMLRLVLIVVGVEAVQRFEWTLSVFGVILIYAAINMLYNKHYNNPSSLSDSKEQYKQGIVSKIISVFINIDEDKNTQSLLVKKFNPSIQKANEPESKQENEAANNPIKKGYSLYATNNLIALVAVIFADVVCAVDSIPAIFTITNDVFIIYMSNLFAVLGLRSMYISLQHITNGLKYIEYGLAAILVFIGVKIFAISLFQYTISIKASLLFVLITISVATVASIINIKSKKNENTTK